MNRIVGHTKKAILFVSECEDDMFVFRQKLGERKMKKKTVKKRLHIVTKNGHFECLIKDLKHLDMNKILDADITDVFITVENK